MIFYTGGNDATRRYMEAMTPPGTRPPRLLSAGADNPFELIKVIRGLQAKFISEGFLAHIDAEVLPKLRNSLIIGMAEARTYCRQEGLKCEFVL